MASRYSVVHNFKYGLDGRRSMLTSVQGTLLQCQDGHINSGGEIEQRMAFVKDANLFPTWTMGIETSSAGIVTFGSKPLVMTSGGAVISNGVAAMSSNGPHQLSVNDQVIISGCTGALSGLNGTQTITGTPTLDEFTFATTASNAVVSGQTITITLTGYSLPTGVSYIPLIHPDITYGAYDFNSSGSWYIMTAIASCNFNGNTFAAVKFGDGYTFLYYNGAVVIQSMGGFYTKGFSGIANSALIGRNLITLINQLDGWSAVQVGGVTNPVTISSPSGVAFTSSINYGTANTGTGKIIEATTYSQSNAADDSNTPAIAQFKITAVVAADVISITAFYDNAGVLPETLCSNVVVPAGATIAQVADLIVRAINANTTSGYTANNTTVTGVVYVTVTAPVSLGAVTFNLSITCSTSTFVGIAVGSQVSVNMIANASLLYTSGIVRQVAPTKTWQGFTQVEVPYAPKTKVAVRSQFVTAGAVGGIAPYKYVWQEEFSGSGNGIRISHTKLASVVFIANLASGEALSGTFKCVITDSTPTTPLTATTPAVTVFLQNIAGASNPT